jgi:hypothetical protein
MLWHAEKPPDRAIPFAPSGPRTIGGGSGAPFRQMSQVNPSLRVEFVGWGKLRRIGRNRRSRRIGAPQIGPAVDQYSDGN